MKDFKPIIESKSCGRAASCDTDDLRSRLAYDLGLMRASGFDPAIIADHEAFNGMLEQFITHPQFGRYLGELTPHQVYAASGVSVLPLDVIRQEVQELAPGARLVAHGYMPFATSIGGNAICFHAPTGRVIWADHDTFGEEDITLKNRTTGDYHTVAFTSEHVEKAVVSLADDFETFLEELLHDRLKDRLAELD